MRASHQLRLVTPLTPPEPLRFEVRVRHADGSSEVYVAQGRCSIDVANDARDRHGIGAVIRVTAIRDGSLQ